MVKDLPEAWPIQFAHPGVQKLCRRRKAASAVKRSGLLRDSEIDPAALIQNGCKLSQPAYRIGNVFYDVRRYTVIPSVTNDNFQQACAPDKVHFLYES